MTTGERIKNARKKAGMDQKQLADALGVKVPFISQYEHDRRNPKRETLRRIADALGVPVYELLDLRQDADDFDAYEQVHMFNMDVEELKIQINFYKAKGMYEEAEMAEKTLKTLIGDTEWVAGPASAQKKEPAPESGLDELDIQLLAIIRTLSADQKQFLLAQLQTLQANQGGK